MRGLVVLYVFLNIPRKRFNEASFFFRCNISYLEEWLREKDLQSSCAMETLGPLSQVAWLLQVSKTTDEDAAEIKQRCSELSPVQVLI